MPTELPIMADSERGVSKTRVSPYFCWRWSVTRKTPPLAPISCPSTTTRLSRSNSSASAEFSASIMVICMVVLPSCFRPSMLDIAQQIGALSLQTRGEVSRGVVEEAVGRHRWDRFGLLHGLVDLLFHARDDLLHPLLAQQIAR